MVGNRDDVTNWTNTAPSATWVIVRQNIHTIPTPATGVASVASARPVTIGNQLIGRPALFPGGKWLAFDSNAEGNQEIFVMPSGGGEARRVTRNSGDDYR
jgi:Tol biopolymer transport system component